MEVVQQFHGDLVALPSLGLLPRLLQVILRVLQVVLVLFLCCSNFFLVGLGFNLLCLFLFSSRSLLQVSQLERVQLFSRALLSLQRLNLLLRSGQFFTQKLVFLLLFLLFVVL